MGARYELSAQACEVQETPSAQLSQCDTVDQPIHMAWFAGFRFGWRNFTIGVKPIEGIPHEESPRVAEPAHVDQRAPLCFGGCGRLSHILADRLTHLFASDLAPPFDTMNRRPYKKAEGFAGAVSPCVLVRFSKRFILIYMYLIKLVNIIKYQIPWWSVHVRPEAHLS